jgi:cobalt-zinc-cadmium resistance protein CzcA
MTLLLIGVSSVIYAQKVISQKDAINLAWTQNQNLKIIGLEVENQKQLLGTAKELPKTSFDLQYGRTQVATMNDYTLSFSQQFSHPKYYKLVADVLNKNLELVKKNENIRKNELSFLIKNIYSKNAYWINLERFLNEQNTVLSSIVKATDVRYQSGETNKIEKVLAESKLNQNKFRVDLITNERNQLKESLKFYINDYSDFLLLNDTLLLSKGLELNGLSIKNNPFVDFTLTNLDLTKALTQVEKGKLLPEFKVGGANQSIEHNWRQFLVQGGVSIPLFATAQKSKIIASQISEKIQFEKLNLIESELQNLLNLATQNLQKAESQIQFLEKSALPQADLIIVTSQKQFRNGEISYPDFLQITQEAWTLKEQYLKAILDKLLIINELEYLTGKNL